MYNTQEGISGVKQEDLLKALAIVNIFETGRPFGDFGAVAVLNDGAGVSFGINQFTHRSGSLAAVIERYLELRGAVGRFILESALPNLRRAEPVVIRAYARDERFKETLRAAAITSEMRIAQMQIGFERYLKPAADACAGSGFTLPLSLGVIYDSLTHGSYERIRDRVSVMGSGASDESDALTFEKAWITAYVRERDCWLASIPRLNSTRYRTRFFLNQIMLGSWNLTLPLSVNGFWLKDEHIRGLLRFADETFGKSVAAGLNPQLHKNPQNPSSSAQSPANTLKALPPPTSTVSNRNTEEATAPLKRTRSAFDRAVVEFDRVDAVVAAIAARTDRVKSLWTAVLGTIWQTLWAVFGFLAGLPRAVWFTVAVIVAVLTLAYLYRQITLGKLREIK
jgi:chitosanase